MSNHETNMQQDAVYDIFHWAAVMQGIEAPNKTDEIGYFGMSHSPFVAPDAASPYCGVANGPVFSDGHGSLVSGPVMSEPAKVNGLMGIALQVDHTGTILNGRAEQFSKDEGVTDGFRFESGCRVIGPTSSRRDPFSATPSPTTPTSSQVKGKKREVVETENRLKCDVPGCKYRGTFRGTYELNRHKKAHTEKPQYECPVLDCKYRGERAFRRKDNFRNHLHQGHTTDACFQCLVHSCNVPLASLQAWFIHSSRHKARSPCWEVLRRQVPAWGWGCPIAGCELHAKFRDIDVIRGHLLTNHEQAERELARSSLVAHGIDPTSTRNCCPLCADGHTLDTGLIEHFGTYHGLFDMEHVTAWNNSVRSAGSTWHFVSLCLYNQFDYLEPLLIGLGRDNDLFCSHCHTMVGVLGSMSFHTHSLGMLKPIRNDQRHHREVLWRLMPSLWMHPMFDDLDPELTLSEDLGMAAVAQQLPVPGIESSPPASG